MREGKALSRSAVAAIAGISQQQIMGYESATSWPRLNTARRLADCYGITLDELSRLMHEDREAADGKNEAPPAE